VVGRWLVLTQDRVYWWSLVLVVLKPLGAEVIGSVQLFISFVWEIEFHQSRAVE
jgi:hypothetical protein